MRYVRAYLLAREAVRGLCSTGTLKERLVRIDPEILSLGRGDISDAADVRDSLDRLRRASHRFEPRDGEGLAVATIEQTNGKGRQAIAWAVLDFYESLVRAGVWDTTK
jgi:hypothetical protein